MHEKQSSLKCMHVCAHDSEQGCSPWVAHVAEKSRKLAAFVAESRARGFT